MLNKEYQKKGYFVIKNVLETQFILKLIEEINAIQNADIYYDQNKNIRRIEKLYDKGINLTLLNNIILKKLKDCFNEKFVIFKDKFNAKPPGGEGFYAHYDGVFKFKNHQDKLKNGWYEYATNFINVLVPLDICNEENGTIEIANSDKNIFEELFNNTKKDGTPNLLEKIEKMKTFEPINLNVGDIVFFKNTCAHRSKKNNSKEHRRNLYYTYNPIKEGSHYNQYFLDKNQSKNKNSKSLSGDI